MDYAVYLLALSLLAVLGRLPLTLVFRLGGALGLLAWAVLPGYRRLVRRNLEIAFGATMSAGEIRRLVRLHFYTLGANLLSVPRLARMPEAAVQERVNLIGLPGLRAALDRKEGVVMAINHIGNWELYAQLIGRVRDVPVGAIFQSQRNKYLNRLIDRDRRRLGLETFDRRKGYLGAVDLVQRGGILAILVDQHAGDGALWTPLFGRLASTSTLAGIIAQSTGAPLVSVAIHTVGTARWRCVIEPPSESRGKSVEEITSELNRTLEREISVSPKDWFWVHDRWKTPGPFILGNARRGFYLPPGQTASDLQPFRLLVRSSNWLGDAVMSIPAVEACKLGRPDLHITVLAPAKLAALWRRVPAVDEVIAIESGESPPALGRRVKEKFDAAILFPNSLRSALEARALGVRHVIGYPGHQRRWLLRRIPPFAPESGGHHADRFLKLAAFCGAPVGKDGASFTRAARKSGAIPRIGVCPGAEYGPAKRWPADHFAELARNLDHPVLLLGSAKEHALCEEIALPVNASQAGKCINLAGKTTLAQAFHAIAGSLCTVSNDSGLMHVAAALGVNQVAVFGSSSPLHTPPLNTRSEVLWLKNEPAYQPALDCAPCFERNCRFGHTRCLNDISAHQVLQGIERLTRL